MRFLHPCGWHSEHHCSGNKPISFMECSNCFVFARSVKPPNASRVVSSLITNGNRLESFEISSSVACVGMANEEAPCCCSSSFPPPTFKVGNSPRMIFTLSGAATKGLMFTPFTFASRASFDGETKWSKGHVPGMWLLSRLPG